METQVKNLYFKSKKISLLLLGVTALTGSRILFFLFDDPEGPNLLIVTVLALVLYAISTAAYLFAPAKIAGIARLLAIVGIQLLIVLVLYFCIR